MQSSKKIKKGQIEDFISDSTQTELDLKLTISDGTDGLPEGATNLYFTTARVLATLLSGLSLATGGTIVSTDSVLIAFGKLQKQITDLTTIVDSKLPKDFSTLTGISLPLVDTDLFAVVRGGVAYKVEKNNLVPASKKTQIIQFAWVGGNYSASAAWWRINNGSSNSKYNFAFTQTPVVVPTNAFSDDTTNPFHEQLMFDGIIKEIVVIGNNNGASWNCDLAIRNYELSDTYNPSTGTGITNNKVVARETIIRGAGGILTVNKFSPLNISTDVLSKYTALRPYFKSEGVANSNWQNALITILIEEA